MPTSEGHYTSKCASPVNDTPELVILVPFLALCPSPCLLWMTTIAGDGGANLYTNPSAQLLLPAIAFLTLSSLDSPATWHTPVRPTKPGPPRDRRDGARSADHHRIGMDMSSDPTRFRAHCCLLSPLARRLALRLLIGLLDGRDDRRLLPPASGRSRPLPLLPSAADPRGGGAAHRGSSSASSPPPAGAGAAVPDPSLSAALTAPPTLRPPTMPRVMRSGPYSSRASPTTLKPREIYNLFREFPGYQSAQFRRSGQSSQAYAFTVFTDQQSALSAMRALNVMAHYFKHSQTNFGYEAEHKKLNDSTYAPQSNPPCPKLFVANLGPKCSEQELAQVISRCPGFLKLKMQNKNGVPVAFVDFQDTSSSTGALNHLQGTILLYSSVGEVMRPL
ncbi:hypothetical protein OPV22_031945 [Ensete ventricosum]|uniref:RRM domain-containing protein n=1 Tax=Ensete ventricosum TaxID=4639 RepID=A0AAV8PQF4_ENSVE|nr:hypothetical protein OPV22_031945 [Ensete ventricosum]